MPKGSPRKSVLEVRRLAKAEAEERGARAGKKKAVARGGLGRVAEAMRLRQARAPDRRRGAAAAAEVDVTRPLLLDEYHT